MKKVRCIQGHDSMYPISTLIKDAIYEVMEEEIYFSGKIMYVLSNGTAWYAERFQNIGCPCNITMCIKHRINYDN